MNAKMLWRVTKGAYEEFNEDKVLRLSGALAYYALFSLAPLVIIVISIAGIVFGTKAVTGQVQTQLRDFFGDQGAQTIQSMISATRKPSTSIIATVVGVVTLLVGASGVFGQLQDALNTIWEVKPKEGRGIMGVLKDRFLSMTMVLGIGFLLLVSMILSAALSALSGVMGDAFGVSPAIAHTLHLLVSFLVITLLFAMIFKVLPDATVKWNDVWSGALFTSALFTLGKFLLGFYLGRAATASTYGAAGSVVIILLWVYYSSIILFFGAEFTQVHAKLRGSRVVAAENAVPVTEEARAEEGIPHAELAGVAASARTRQRPRVHSVRHAPAMASAPLGPSPEVERAWQHIPKGSEIIHDKPWRFLSVAVGIGVLTGWFFKGEWLGRRKGRV